MPEVPLEANLATEDDSEQELSSQLQEVDSRSGGWSSWSDWSRCSRSCDGGVSHQLRTCTSSKTTGTCRGDHIRYKICNMQIYVTLLVVFTIADGKPLSTTSVIRGPSSKTTVLGSDGSSISSITPGSTIIREEHPGYAVISHDIPSIRGVLVHSPSEIPSRNSYYVNSYDPVLATSSSLPGSLSRTVVVNGSPVTFSSSSYIPHGDGLIGDLRSYDTIIRKNVGVSSIVH